jgi:two-component system, OmpR family, sensor kinase
MRDAFASLTSRLVVTAVALVAVVALVIGTAATVALHSYLSSRLDQDVMALAHRLPRESGQIRPPGDADRDNRFDLSRYGTLSGYARPGDFYAEVTTDAGQQALGRKARVSLGSLTVDTGPQDIQVNGLGEYRVAAARAPDGTVIFAGLPTTSVDGPVTRLLLWELLVGSLGIAAAAGAGTFVVRRQLRPLREVASTAHTVARLPLAEGEIAIAPRVPEHLTDERTEVGQVGSALNTLLVHVESSLAQRHRSEQQVRQFVADASHELRTPLTTIAGYTELARRRPEDAGAVRTALGKVEEESARMTSMVEDLLLLARLDAGRPLARDLVDLSRLLVEAISDARVVAPDHVWRLELPAESVEVTGDADRLHQVVTNLLANARKHTPPGTQVTLTGGRTSTGYGFSVHDDGPGFPPDLVGTAFERFVRGDPSRTRAGAAGPALEGTVEGTVEGAGAPVGGAGLGLSLVEAIVSAHGGTVTLDSHLGSTTIAVSLPG